MLKKVLGLLVLIIALASALVAYSMTNTAPEISNVTKTVDNYKQKIVAKTKEVAAPVLKEAGFDVEKVPDAKDLNVIENQMQDATEKVNEATKMISQRLMILRDLQRRCGCELIQSSRTPRRMLINFPRALEQ